MDLQLKPKRISDIWKMVMEPDGPCCNIMAPKGIYKPDQISSIV